MAANRPTSSPARIGRRRFAAGAVASMVVAASSTGCSAIRVVTRSDPSVFVGRDRMTVSVDRRRTRVEGTMRDDYLASSEPGDARDLRRLEEVLDNAFLLGLGRRLEGMEVRWAAADPDRPPGSGLHLVIQVRELHLGAFAGGSAEPSRLRVRFRWHRDGELVDEIDVRSRVDASIHDSSVAGRLEKCADVLAKYAFEYMEGSRAASRAAR